MSQVLKHKIPSFATVHILCLYDGSIFARYVHMFLVLGLWAYTCTSSLSESDLCGY
jgi:hypothetical protein